MSKKYIEGPSVMAELAASHRAEESAKPIDERICYDQYAVRFLSSDALEIMKDPVKLKAFKKQVGPLAVAMGNSMRARARYFDDFIKQAVKQGLDQLVILGAGYDTRAYRIEGLRDIKVFEVDHPDTQHFKIQKIREIFGSTQDNVVYVPFNFETQTLNQDLFEEYDILKNTLFVMEGLIYYLTPEAVDEILSFIAGNSSNGSTILFDYFHQCVIDGTCEMGKIFRYYAEPVGETLKFGLEEETVEDFLLERGFSNIKNITSKDYKEAYFQGINENREVCSQVYFAHAVVD